MVGVARNLMPGPVQVKTTGQPEVDIEIDKLARRADEKSSDLAGARLILGLKAYVGKPLRIEHGLGRKPVTWWICAPNVATIVSQYGTPDDRILYLSAAATVSFDLVVL